LCGAYRSLYFGVFADEQDRGKTVVPDRPRGSSCLDLASPFAARALSLPIGPERIILFSETDIQARGHRRFDLRFFVAAATTDGASPRRGAGMPAKKHIVASKSMGPDDAPSLDRDWFDRAEISARVTASFVARRSVGRRRTHPRKRSTFGSTAMCWPISAAPAPAGNRGPTRRSARRRRSKPIAVGEMRRE
jgi:hypothetical protein